MKKCCVAILGAILVLALPAIALAVPSAVRITDPSTHISASVLAEAEDGADIAATPASTYGSYVRADNAPELEANQVEFSFNLDPNDSNHSRNANVTVTMDTEYAGWNASIYIQHDGSISKASEQVSVNVADDGTIAFPMHGLSTVTIILADSGDAGSGDAATHNSDGGTTDAANVAGIKPGTIAVVAGAIVLVVVGVVLVVRRRGTK